MSVVGGAPRRAGWLSREGVEAPEDQRTSTSSDLKDLDMDDPTLCCPARGGYCNRCDLIVGVDGLHVTAAERDARGRLVVTVESEPVVMGCPSCGVLARGHGRDEVELVDAPAFGAPVRIRWRKRRWVCPDLGCPVGSFTEQDESVAAPRSRLTTRCPEACSAVQIAVPMPPPPPVTTAVRPASLTPGPP